MPPCIAWPVPRHVLDGSYFLPRTAICQGFHGISMTFPYISINFQARFQAPSGRTTVKHQPTALREL